MEVTNHNFFYLGTLFANSFGYILARRRRHREDSDSRQQEARIAVHRGGEAAYQALRPSNHASQIVAFSLLEDPSKLRLSDHGKDLVINVPRIKEA